MSGKSNSTSKDVVDVYVQSEGRPNPQIVKVSIRGNVRDLLDAVKPGEPEDAAVFLQDEDEELDLDLSLKQAGILEKPRIHLGRRRRRIEVTVHFNGETQSRRFGPGSTVARVTKWAIRAFNLSGAKETEYALLLCESDKFLSPDTHIGCLLKPKECELCFDLVLEDAAQG